MAQLHRFVKLHDRQNTHIFTFILSKKITKPMSPDIVSRDFHFGDHRWCVLFMKRERHVSAYLTLKDPSEGLFTYLDYSFTLIHKEHFTKNETYAEKNRQFSKDRHTNGCRTFVSNEELVSRKFCMDDQGDFLVEVALRNVRTVFEHELEIAPRTAGHSSARNHHLRYDKYEKYETTYFAFGGFDWSVSIYPQGDCPDNDGRAMVYLSRHTGFSHLCKMRYRLTLGHADRCVESDYLEHSFNIEGQGECYELEGVDVYRFERKGYLRVTVELTHVTVVSEARVPVFERGKNCAVLYDRDKQKWALVTDVERGSLRVRLFNNDARNVPRNLLRYVCWSVSLVTARGELIPLPSTPFTRHYVQCEQDDGYEMKTNISINELKDSENFYLEDAQFVRFHVEWLDSLLLLHSNYHHYDSIRQVHNYQMRSEISALQAENYTLEKQLFSYQMSIGAAHQQHATPTHHTPGGGSRHAVAAGSGGGGGGGSNTHQLPPRGAAADTNHINSLHQGDVGAGLYPTPPGMSP